MNYKYDLNGPPGMYAPPISLVAILVTPPWAQRKPVEDRHSGTIP